LPTTEGTIPLPDRSRDTFLGAERIAVLLGEGLPSNMRARAAAAIGRLGRDGRSARGALKKLVNDSDEEIAAAARKALERVG